MNWTYWNNKFHIEKHLALQKMFFYNRGAIGKRHRLQKFMLHFAANDNKRFCYRNVKTGDYEITFDGRHFNKLSSKEKEIIDSISDREYATISIPLHVPCRGVSQN
jgi:hypothetical protein